MTSKSIEASVSNKLGLDTMSDEERAGFLEHIGELVLRSAYVRFAAGLEEAERQEFQGWMESQQENERLLEEAGERYPGFAEVIDLEMQALHETIEALV